MCSAELKRKSSNAILGRKYLPNRAVTILMC